MIQNYYKNFIRRFIFCILWVTVLYNTPISALNNSKQNFNDTVPFFEPRLALPDVMYILGGVENSVYHKSYIERWNPYSWAIDGEGKNWQYYERYFRTDSATAGDLKITLYDANSLKPLQQKTIKVIYGNRNKNNGKKIIQVIGDSFSYNGFWFHVTDSLCPNLEFVGMRKSYNSPLMGEGRGGWRLETYFRQLRSSQVTYKDSFSPFLQPKEPYKYFGNTNFWKNVLNGSEVYGEAQFTKKADETGFDKASGLKQKPQVNDVMYNDAISEFVVWSGKNWKPIAESQLLFHFDYAKYLEAWNIKMPDIVAIALGMNDFCCGGAITDAYLNTWKLRMDTLIKSVQAAAKLHNKKVRIAICTHTTEFSSANSATARNPIIRNANLFEARYKLLKIFDTDLYRNQGVDVVDIGSAFDSDYGFKIEYKKPFSVYEGQEREIIGLNTPHPGNGGYWQLGVRFAGYIQAVR